MARVAVEIPKIGLVMEAVRVTRWLKNVGDAIRQGEPLLEVETEKSVVEIEAAVSGRLEEILTAVGAEPDYAFRGYAAGAVDYIAKPFDPWVLRAKVAVFVDLYVKNRQLREQSELLRQQAEGSAGGLLAELSRRLSAIEASAAGLASVPAVKTDAALADGLGQLDRSIGRLRDTLDALGADD